MQSLTCVSWRRRPPLFVCISKLFPCSRWKSYRPSWDIRRCRNPSERVESLGNQHFVTLWSEKSPCGLTLLSTTLAQRSRVWKWHRDWTGTVWMPRWWVPSKTGYQQQQQVQTIQKVLKLAVNATFVCRLVLCRGGQTKALGPQMARLVFFIRDLNKGPCLAGSPKAWQPWSHRIHKEHNPIPVPADYLLWFLKDVPGSWHEGININ